MALHGGGGGGGGGVGGGWAMKNWGWVTIFQHVKKGGSGKIMHLN